MAVHFGGLVRCASILGDFEKARWMWEDLSSMRVGLGRWVSVWICEFEVWRWFCVYRMGGCVVIVVLRVFLVRLMACVGV